MTITLNRKAASLIAFATVVAVYTVPFIVKLWGMLPANAQ